MHDDYKLEAADPANIVIIENFISAEHLDAIYDYCYSITKWESQSIAQTDKISTGATMKKDSPEVYDIMSSYLNKVQKAVEYKFGRKLEPSVPGIRRWDAGERQGPHADGETVHGVATDTYIVDYGSIMYLNDNYDGGELYFPAYDIDFQPKAGTLAFFPSSTYYVHGVKEVIAGVRYTSPHFWIPVKHKRLIEMTKNDEQQVYN